MSFLTSLAIALKVTSSISLFLSRKKEGSNLIIRNLQTDSNRPFLLREQAKKGFSLATDVADYLAKKGVPFREAHEIVGKVVAYCLDNGKTLEDLTLEEFRKFSDKFEEDVLSLMSVEGSINSRNIVGGTAREQVEQEIKRIKEEEGF